MSVYYYEPFFSLNDFHRLFDDVWPARGSNNLPSEPQQPVESGQNQNQVARAFQPRLDIYESPENNQVVATFELPGLRKEDVNIDVRDNRLHVSGEVNISKEFNESGYVLRERRTGRFSRTVPLPAGIQPQDIKASLENGVLTVTFPKTSPEQLPKKIAIA